MRNPGTVNFGMEAHGGLTFCGRVTPVKYEKLFLGVFHYLIPCEMLILKLKITAVD